MKKLIIFTLILCLLAMFTVACNGNQGDSDTESQIESGNTDTEVGSTDTESDTDTGVDTDTNTDTDTDTETDTDTDTETDTDTDNGGSDVKPTKDWADDGVLKILAIGNSFSDDAMEYVYQVAKDAGVENIKLGNMFIGGCSLATHLSNAKNEKGAYDYRTNTEGKWSTKGGTSIQTAVSSENWDFITFQQVSGYSGVAESYDDLVELISIVKPLCPDATLAWHMTWAYKVGSGHGDFAKYNRDQMTMYNAIVNAVNTKILTNTDISIVIPSGTSIQNVRTSFIGDMTRDGYHLSTGLGRYIASMTFVKALTGLSIDNSSTVPKDVNELQLKTIIESVNNAYNTPYEVTNSSYPKKALGYGIDDSQNVGVIPEGYVQLTAEQMGLTASSFYNSTGIDTWNGSGNFAKGFMATKKFTKEELPIGTIIEIAAGWQYRPEGWTFVDSRPENVSTVRIIIDEDWWGFYNERGFNISQIAHTTSSNVVITLSTEEVANTIFKIIVPESEKNQTLN